MNGNKNATNKHPNVSSFIRSDLNLQRLVLLEVHVVRLTPCFTLREAILPTMMNSLTLNAH